MRLDEICTLTKGTSPTLKTVPGEYPLIVTGQEPRSAAEYQFDGEAVCIPMVSSTGHGHASLKRVHYASGKFAVANIITACEVIDKRICDTRFLYHYLQHYKNELIVALMQGTANVTISRKLLSSVPIALPPIEEQHRIVDLVDALDAAIAAAESQRLAAKNLYVAALGELSLRGPERAIGDVVQVARSGGTPSRKVPDNFGGSIPWLKSGEVDNDAIESAQESITERALSGSSAWLVPPNATLVAMYGQGDTKGKAGFLRSAVATNQAVLALVPNNEIVHPRYLLHAVRSRTDSLRGKAVGAAQPNLSKALIISEVIPLPPLDSQVVLADAMDCLSSSIGQFTALADSLYALRGEVLSALLSGAHRVPETYDELMGA